MEIVGERGVAPLTVGSIVTSSVRGDSVVVGTRVGVDSCACARHAPGMSSAAPQATRANDRRKFIVGLPLVSPSCALRSLRFARRRRDGAHLERSPIGSMNDLAMRTERGNTPAQVRI